MSIRTQSAQQEFNSDDIERLIRNTAAREHVSFACPYWNVVHMANGRAQHNVELFCPSKGLGRSSNSKQNKC